MRVSLAEWARRQAPPIPLSTAYRQFHEGRLPADVQGKAQKLDSGSIVVDMAEPDPIAGVDIPALVTAMERAGFVVLRADEAEALGIARAVPTTEIENNGRS